MKKRITIKDIAEALGISKSTVSRALSPNPYNVKKETLIKILEKAKEMGYERSKLAINFRNNRTKQIGLVIPELVTTYYVSFIDRMQTLLTEKGYQVILACCNENPDIEREKLLWMLDNQVEGILISACHNKKNIDVYQKLLDKGIPLVFFDRTIDDFPTPKVMIDDYIKSFFMVEYLIRSGRKRIMHLAGPPFIQNSWERIRAYKDAMAKFGFSVQPDFIIPSGVNFKDGMKSMEDFFKKQIPFDAIFCFTEMAALGAKSFLQNLHYTIPDDVAICTVSGTILSTLVHPTLTAVEQPVEDMADKAVELLLEKIENMDTPDRTEVLPAQMILRSSTQQPDGLKGNKG